jgi:hypothetical protein
MFRTAEPSSVVSLVVKLAISVGVRVGLHSKITTGLEIQIAIVAEASLVALPVETGTGPFPPLTLIAIVAGASLVVLSIEAAIRAFPALTLVLVAAALSRLRAPGRIARTIVASVSLVPTLVPGLAPSAALVQEESIEVPPLEVETASVAGGFVEVAASAEEARAEVVADVAADGIDDGPRSSWSGAGSPRWVLVNGPPMTLTQD